METDIVVRRAWEALENDLQTLGYELIEVETGRQGGSLVLRLYIDKVGERITLDDCTRAAQMVGPLLDHLDFISERYVLEVSSPGWNRPVRKHSHFVRYVGYPFVVTTAMPVAGRAKFKGTLKSVENDLIRLDVAGTEVALHLDNIKKARLDR